MINWRPLTENIFVFVLEELGEEILGNLSRDREAMTRTRDKVRMGIGNGNGNRVRM